MSKADNTPSTELVPLPPRATAVLESLDIKFADTADIQWRIAERQALAGSLDELLNGSGARGLREHIGEPFMIRGVDFLRSAFPGSPVFAVIDAATPDGEPVVYTSGALSVVVQLARGLKMGWWTGELVQARFSTDEPTAEGNRPYMLVRA